ncbi:MAG: glycosyltransferase family 4 protein [Bacteroidetes bacterium HGW-Bacteroidetes-8]|jgi:glycosyltransferase involved in cell wall biosynthesis|nr:MAG: glycosyltransferase family 4 protein [Bacteroidetes bacterium HGW-Bacteroidetes-8]
MAIKVVFCLPSLHLVGGMEKVLTIKANYFADVFEYDVTIVLTDSKEKAPYFPLSDKVKVVNLDIDFENIRLYPIYLKVILYSYKQFLYKRRLTKLLMSLRPDITVSMLRREINFITRIKDGSKKIGEMQFNRLNYRDFDISGRYSAIRHFFSKLWMNQLVYNLKKVDKFVVLSWEDLERWPELNNVVVIHNPIDKLPERVSDCSSKKVISAGRFVGQKGFDMLLDSWKIVNSKHPEWSLHIYGAGDRTTFNEQIIRNGIEGSCTLNGPLRDLTEQFCDSSIFAFSSRFEGFALVLTEAMSYGVPPVAFSCPCGPKDLITDGVNGLLVTPQDVDELAEKICYLIENEEIRKEIGRNARERAKNFTIDIMAKEWDKLFKALLSTN